MAGSAAASEAPAAAASTITWDDIFATSYSQSNRGSNPDAKAPETPEEYIEQKGNGDIMGSMMVGMVDPLNIPEEQFMDIFTEYMVKALGHANQKIVKDYATRSGEALDWMLAELDPDYVAKYAHAVNYKGNKHFQNPCSHSYYYVGMTQWRDTGTETNTNNMWPYTVRLLQQKAVEKGCEDKFWQGAAAGMDVLAFGLCACTKLDGMETTNTGDLSVYLAHSADYEQITVSTVPAEKIE